MARRSRRLGLDGSQVSVLAEIQLEKILATLDHVKPAIAVIDSKEKNLATRRRFYIQISRVKTDLSLVVDSKEEAQKQISRFSGDKTSALETMEQASKRGEPMMDLGNDQADSSVPQQEQDRQLEIRLDRS